MSGGSWMSAFGAGRPLVKGGEQVDTTTKQDMTRYLLDIPLSKMLKDLLEYALDKGSQNQRTS